MECEGNDIEVLVHKYQQASYKGQRHDILKQFTKIQPETLVYP